MDTRIQYYKIVVSALVVSRNKADKTIVEWLFLV